MKLEAFYSFDQVSEPLDKLGSWAHVMWVESCGVALYELTATSETHPFLTREEFLDDAYAYIRAHHPFCSIQIKGVDLH